LILLNKERPNDIEAKKNREEQLKGQISIIEKRVQELTNKYSLLKSTISRIAPQVVFRDIDEDKVKLRFMKSMFRCERIKGPILIGPLPGEGKSKEQNLHELISKESKYLVKMKQ
jgi:hypothetical protein